MTHANLWAFRYILRALEQSWHWACLVCSVCRGILSELGSSLFVRGDLVLCRRDYIRLVSIYDVQKQKKSQHLPLVAAIYWAEAPLRIIGL